jgi:hypothetical protein
VPVPHEFGHSRLNTPHKPPAQDETKRIHRSAQRWFRDVLHVFTAALREIFDESAYERFLQRTQAQRSVESYRAFLREREAIILRKPRCC